MNVLYFWVAIAWLGVLINAAPTDTQHTLWSSEPPLPGRSGVHYDADTQIVTGYYGDDKLHLHMAHLQRNQEAHPENRAPMARADKAKKEQNRANALQGMPTGGCYLGTDERLVCDEKHPAMFDNPHHSTTTTVEKLPESESHREGGLLSSMSQAMKTFKKMGKLQPNPGWKPLDPRQKLGHELPANFKVKDHVILDIDPISKAPRRRIRVAPKSRTAEERKIDYTPITPSGMLLRTRKGVSQAPAVEKKVKAPARSKTLPTYAKLSPGYVSPPGRVWHSVGDHGVLPPNSFASHFGAPLQQVDPMTRQPPRPQFRDGGNGNLNGRPRVSSSPSISVSSTPRKQKGPRRGSISTVTSQNHAHAPISAPPLSNPVTGRQRANSDPTHSRQSPRKATNHHDGGSTIKTPPQAPAVKSPGNAPGQPIHQNAVASSSSHPTNGKQPKKKPSVPAPKKKPSPADKKGKKRA